ncbi:hypothetical protein [Streptomyces longispororuber]|uniref:hypothetical protein n=1 Tax=Streptomyces longispororuber TaxID=68230 RepID=UPI00210919B6|nr:hypothetical protein [Streptomyces longispororuber]MCQ4211522.1 hypothetical protein [Streptomyces longispororuber]
MVPAVLGVATALAVTVISGGWGWFQGQWSDPPGLTVHSTIGSCPVYTDKSLSQLRKDSSNDKLAQATPVTSPGDDPATLALTLQARTSEAIVVTGVTIHRVSAGPVPRKGSVIEMECGGALSPRVFNVDLMRPQIRLVPVAKGAGKAVDFPFTVSAGDPEELDLQMFPGGHDVRFSVEVHWISEGEEHSETVMDGTQAFRVIGPGRLPTYSFGDTVSR